jgi:ribonuclease P protein component
VQRVYKGGASAANRWLFVRTLPNRYPHPRITVVIGKKVAKKAVDRNRLKRLVRQALQVMLEKPITAHQLIGKDIVVTLHKTPDQPYTLDTVQAEVERCFAKFVSV